MADLYGALAPVRVAGALHVSAPAGLVLAPVKKYWQDRVAVPASTVVTTKVYLGDIPSNAILDNDLSLIRWEAFGASVTLSIGDSSSATALMNGKDVSAAGSGGIDDTITVPTRGDPLWKRLGYAADPGGLLRIFATFGGATTTGSIKNMSWKFVGSGA